MDFFNDIGRKTSEVTTKIAKETKLKLKINGNKGQILDIYEEIGQKIYENHINHNNANLKQEIEYKCKEIDELAKCIEKARMEILKLNKKKQCDSCNSEIQNKDIFCPQCGKKQEKEEMTTFDEAIEKLEEVEIKPRNKEKAKVIKKELEEKVEQE